MLDDKKFRNLRIIMIIILLVRITISGINMNVSFLEKLMIKVLNLLKDTFKNIEMQENCR